ALLGIHRQAHDAFPSLRCSRRCSELFSLASGGFSGLPHHGCDGVDALEIARLGCLHEFISEGADEMALGVTTPVELHVSGNVLQLAQALEFQAALQQPANLAI